MIVFCWTDLLEKNIWSAAAANCCSTDLRILTAEESEYKSAAGSIPPSTTIVWMEELI